jgi:hypothetical protein
MKQSSMFDDAAGTVLFSVPDTPPVEPPFQTPKEKGHAMLIARSQPRKCYSKDNTVIYYEYRVRKLTRDERDEQAEQYNEDRLYNMATVYCFEQQTVWDTEGQRDEKGWTVYDWAESEQDVIVYDCAAYLTAESLHPMHRQAVERVTKRKELTKEKQRLNELLDGLVMHYRNLYAAELKRRRLYKKAMDGKAPQNIIDDIRFPMIEECNNKRASLKQQIADIDKQIESL